MPRISTNIIHLRAYRRAQSIAPVPFTNLVADVYAVALAQKLYSSPKRYCNCLDFLRRNQVLLLLDLSYKLLIVTCV